jgi:hypothetical protein
MSRFEVTANIFGIFSFSDKISALTFSWSAGPEAVPSGLAQLDRTLKALSGALSAINDIVSEQHLLDAETRHLSDVNRNVDSCHDVIRGLDQSLPELQENVSFLRTMGVPLEMKFRSTAIQERMSALQRYRDVMLLSLEALSM